VPEVPSRRRFLTGALVSGKMNADAPMTDLLTGAFSANEVHTTEIPILSPVHS
jgi:hypothetical protein